MEYRLLGNTGIKVSRLCFGSLTISPLQSALSVDDGANIIVSAINRGVNFIDTAKLYNSYSYIKKALNIVGKNNIVISSRSYDYTYEGMKESVENALKEIDRDYIDVFGLHEQESIYTIKGHFEAIEYLIQAKKEGKIRAINISTHNIAAVNAACSFPEIDIIHPIINYKGIGIADGNIEEMLNAVEKAKANGKGIYSMKAIGGGNLLNNVKKCLDFVISNKNIDSVAVGMQSEDEIVANLEIFNGNNIPDDIKNNLKNKKRILHIDDWCEGCGRCVLRCKLNALEIVDGKSHVNKNICTLCGYCSTVCPQFCIKII